MHAPFAPSRIIRDFGAVATLASISPNQLRWDPLPIPRAPTDFVDGLVTYGRQRRPRAAKRLRHSSVCRQPLDAHAGILRCRRRAADRAAAGPAAARRPSLGGWWSSRWRSPSFRAALRFRVELPEGRRARLCVRELRRAVSTARSGPDRLERPGLRARLPDARGLVRGSRRATTS